MMKHLRDLIAPTIVALLVAGAANGAIWQWSHTASSNGSADPSINFQEGQAPSSVNDSARALMARVADWRDDFSGLLATTGTSTAYLVTTNQGFTTTPTNGQLVSITPNATNGASATLAADGGTAFPIQTSPGVAVAAGVLVSGTPYDLKFVSASSAWVLKGFYANPFNVPLGAVLDYTGTTAPNSNFVLANGQCISRTTYATYFSLVSTTFGACDGSTTFGVPDLSNRIIAGLQMAGTARITVAGGNFDGNTLGASGGLQNHTMTTAELVAHTHTGNGSTSVTGSHNHTGPTDIETQTFAHNYNTATGKSGQATGFASVGGTIWNGADTNAVTGTQLTNHTHPFTTSTTGDHQHTYSFTSSSTGSTTPFSVMPPTMVLSKIVRIF